MVCLLQVWGRTRAVTSRLNVGRISRGPESFHVGAQALDADEASKPNLLQAISVQQFPTVTKKAGQVGAGVIAFAHLLSPPRTLRHEGARVEHVTSHTHGGRRWSGPSKSVEGRSAIWAAAEQLVGLPGWEDGSLLEALKDVVTALEDKPSPVAAVRLYADGWISDLEGQTKYAGHIEAYRLHREGLTLNEIVKVTGQSRTTVKERLLWMGVTPKLEEPHASPAEMAWVRELRQDGLSYRQITLATGYSVDRVRNAIRAKRIAS